MMFQVFKSAVGHSIFGGSVKIHWQAQWIWTFKKIAMSDSQAFCVCFLLSLFFKYHECWIFGRRKPLIAHIYIYISKIPIFAYINIDAFSKQTSCVASTMLASSRNVIIPTPPHPNPMTCVAPSMCASARNMMLRSTDHVCKFKERYHPHPTPTHPMTCVAPTMCASARNVTIPTPPHPNPMTCVALTMCASARNVIIPTPPHPNPMTCVAPTMCASARNMMLRSTDHVCKFKERYHPHPTPPQPIPWLA